LHARLRKQEQVLVPHQWRRARSSPSGIGAPAEDDPPPAPNESLFLSAAQWRETFEDWPRSPRRSPAPVPRLPTASAARRANSPPQLLSSAPPWRWQQRRADIAASRFERFAWRLRWPLRAKHRVSCDRRLPGNMAGADEEFAFA